MIIHVLKRKNSTVIAIESNLWQFFNYQDIENYVLSKGYEVYKLIPSKNRIEFNIQYSSTIVDIVEEACRIQINNLKEQAIKISCSFKEKIPCLKELNLL
jgi:hypothetical protein